MFNFFKFNYEIKMRKDSTNTIKSKHSCNSNIRHSKRNSSFTQNYFFNENMIRSKSNFRLKIDNTSNFIPVYNSNSTMTEKETIEFKVNNTVKNKAKFKKVSKDFNKRINRNNKKSSLEYVKASTINENKSIFTESFIRSKVKVKLKAEKYSTYVLDNFHLTKSSTHDEDLQNLIKSLEEKRKEKLNLKDIKHEKSIPKQNLCLAMINDFNFYSKSHILKMKNDIKLSLKKPVYQNVVKQDFNCFNKYLEEYQNSDKLATINTEANNCKLFNTINYEANYVNNNNDKHLKSSRILEKKVKFNTITNEQIKSTFAKQNIIIKSDSKKPLGFNSENEEEDVNKLKALFISSKNNNQISEENSSYVKNPKKKLVFFCSKNMNSNAINQECYGNSNITKPITPLKISISRNSNKKIGMKLDTLHDYSKPKSLVNLTTTKDTDILTKDIYLNTSISKDTINEKQKQIVTSESKLNTLNKEKNEIPKSIYSYSLKDKKSDPKTKIIYPKREYAIINYIENDRYNKKEMNKSIEGIDIISLNKEFSLKMDKSNIRQASGKKIIKDIKDNSLYKIFDNSEEEKQDHKEIVKENLNENANLKTYISQEVGSIQSSERNIQQFILPPIKLKSKPEVQKIVVNKINFLATECSKKQKIYSYLSNFNKNNQRTNLKN